MKHIRTYLLAALLLLLLTVGVSAAPYTFSSLDGVCTVDNNGTSHFTMTGVVNFHQPVSEFIIPLGQNVSGAEAEIYNTKVRKDGGISTLVFERESGFAGEMNVTWRYTIRNTVATTSDSQVYTVPLLAAQAGDVAALSYTITMPDPFDTSPVFSSGYYADGIDNYMTVAISEGVITAQVNQTLMAGDALTMSLTTEPGYFSMRNASGTTAAVDTVSLVLCFPLALILWLWKLRYPLPKLTTRSHPPAGANAGVLRHILTDDQADLALMAANWAVSGYLSLVCWSDGSLQLQQQMPMGNEREVYETKVFQALFSKESTVQAKSWKYRSVESYAQKPVRHFWQQRLYQKNAPNGLLLRLIGLLGALAASLCAADTLIGSFNLRLIPVILLTLAGGALAWPVQTAAISCLHRAPQQTLLRGILCGVVLQVWAAIAGTGSLMLAALILQLLIGLSLVFGVRRSRNGVAMLEQVLALRRYLSRFKASDVADLQGQASSYFYQMLPYAQALGVGKKFTKAFAGVTLEPCSWYHPADDTPIREPMAFYQAFCQALAVLHGEDAPAKFHLPQLPTKGPKAPRTRPSRNQEPTDRQRRTGDYNHEYHRNNDPRRRD